MGAAIFLFCSSLLLLPVFAYSENDSPSVESDGQLVKKREQPLLVEVSGDLSSKSSSLSSAAIANSALSSSAFSGNEALDRFVVSRQNAAVYRDIIPSQIFKLISKEQILISVAEKLNFSFPSLDKKYKQAQEPSSADLFEQVLAAVNFYPGVEYRQDYLWFSAGELKLSLGAELVRRFEFSLSSNLEKAESVEGKNKVGREVDDKSEHPAKQDALQAQDSISFANKKELLFEEVFTLSGAANFAGYFHKTLRHLDLSKQDRVSIYSPLLKKEREVLEANRGDALFSSVLSPDDFFVFSENSARLKVKLLRTQALLLPFASLSQLSLVQTEGNLLPRSEFGPGMPFVLFNYQSKQFPSAAPWMPTSLHFVPRNALVFEFEYEDLNSEYSRALLIVDKESSLPVYKFVYDQKGDLQRSVVGVWARAESENRAFSFLSSLLAIDAKARRVDVLNTTSVSM